MPEQSSSFFGVVLIFAKMSHVRRWQETTHTETYMDILTTDVLRAAMVNWAYNDCEGQNYIFDQKGYLDENFCLVWSTREMKLQALWWVWVRLQHFSFLWNFLLFYSFNSFSDECWLCRVKINYWLRFLFSTFFDFQIFRIGIFYDNQISHQTHDSLSVSTFAERHVVCQ